MKKLILSAITIVVCVAGLNAQVCTPDPLYMDSVFGAWPDTTTNFPPGSEGVFYSEVLDFKVPLLATDVDPTLPALDVDSFHVDDVVGLPPGLGYECGGNGSCTFLGGDQGCAVLSGTPTTAGSYDVTIETTGYGFLGVLIPVPYSFEGYRIDIDAVGVMEITRLDFYVTQNSPNPFRGNTEIVYQTKETGNILFDVYDLLGKKVYSEIYQSTFGQNVITFNSGNTPAGVYMYTLSQGDKVITKKMNIAGE